MKNKLINKINLIIVTIAIIFSSTSCEDFFDQKSGNRISPDVHYTSTDDLFVSMQGCLAPLKEALPKLIMIDGLLSDMMDVTPNSDAYLNEINQHIFSASNPFLDPSDYYKVILNVNEVLANIHKVSEVDPYFDDFTSHQMQGYLMGIKTLAYFTIIRLHGEAALIDDNLTSMPEGDLVYLPKEVMLDTLINQLTPYLIVDTEFVEYWFGGMPNTKAIIGELYLEKNDYANAAFYLKISMDSYIDDDEFFKLDKTLKEDSWATIFGNATGEDQMTENLSYIRFDTYESQLNPLTKWMLPSDEYLVKPTQNIIDKFVIDEDEFRGLTYTYDTIEGGIPFVNKYALTTGEPYSTNIIWQRSADVHLLLAEALNRMGDYQNALLLVNGGFSQAAKVPTEYRKWNKGIGVRGRVDLPDINLPEGMVDPNQIMLFVEDVIIEERAKELAFEGKRWFDLMRIARRRGNAEYLAAQVGSKFSDQNQKKEVWTKLRNAGNWYIPHTK